MTQCAKNKRWENFDLSSTIKSRLRNDWTNATNYRTTIRTVNDTFVHERVSMLLAFEGPALRLFTNRSLVKTILSSTCAWRYSQLKISHTTVHWPLRLMERLCLHLHPCPRTLEDVDELKKAVEKTINRSLRLTKRFYLHKRLKGSERLKRFFTSRLTIWRHADWLSDRCSRLNDSNETADVVWDSSGRSTRPKAEIRTPIAFQENRQSAYSLARRRLLRECAPSVVDP